MSRTLFFVLSLFALTGAGAANPLYDFFHYREPPPPVGGDCAIAQAIGPAATWYGEFAGNRIDEYYGSRQPVSARGCFDSEYACRAWQNDAVSYVGRGGVVYMRCRQGARGY